MDQITKALSKPEEFTMSRQYLLVFSLLSLSPLMHALSLPKKWKNAHDYAKMAYQVGFPATASAIGFVGATHTLNEARNTYDGETKLSLNIIGTSTLLASLDAAVTATQGYGDKRRPQRCNRSTAFMLGIYRIANLLLPTYSLLDEYETINGNIIRGHADEGAKQQFIIRRVIPYILPAIVSGAKSANNLLCACKPTAISAIKKIQALRRSRAAKK